MVLSIVLLLLARLFWTLQNCCTANRGPTANQALALEAASCGLFHSDIDEN
jgi:hypothetical protein